LFLSGRWLRKPHIARRIIVVTFVGILISDIHELVFITSLPEINNGRGGMCVVEFPINHRSAWLLFHLIISIINSILPLLINICCTVTISCVVTKKKMNTRAPGARMYYKSFMKNIILKSIFRLQGENQAKF
jgi:hypothetical protein